MDRKLILGATTALVFSLIASIGTPAFADNDRGNGRGQEQKAAKQQVRVQRQAARAPRVQQMRAPRAQEARATARLNADSRKDVISHQNTAQRLQDERNRTAERAQVNTERTQARQTRAADQVQLKEQRTADRMKLEQTRTAEKLQTQQARFDKRLSNEQFKAKQLEQRQQFAAQLAASRQQEQLRLRELQQRNRLAAYRVQSDYFNRLESQRLSMLNERNFAFNNSPAYYSDPYYRYYRGGSYFTTSQYGGTMLQQAVNYGCQQGYDSGVADRTDRSPLDFGSSLIYQDANYGYSGILVPRSDYNYYFRQGYKRCYRDGYYSRGSSASSGLLNTVLNSVLGLQNLR